MITGFNTDVEYEGVTYHVQTEDKGLDTPLILSLVYVGGAILASKRTNYRDLIDKGFTEGELTERLQRQHKLICAAIRAGRVEDLKRMGERDASPRVESGVVAARTPAATETPLPEPTGQTGPPPRGRAEQPQVGEESVEDAQPTYFVPALETSDAFDMPPQTSPPAAEPAPVETLSAPQQDATPELETAGAVASSEAFFISLLDDEG
ncbi:MAG: hypothetical protein ACRD68_01925, partial [Pyrinomonadaceae bacterium]